MKKEHFYHDEIGRTFYPYDKGFYYYDFKGLIKYEFFIKQVEGKYYPAYTKIILYLAKAKTRVLMRYPCKTIGEARKKLIINFLGLKDHPEYQRR